MDRIFMFSKEALEDKYDDDFKNLYNILKRRSNVNCDTVILEGQLIPGCFINRKFRVIPVGPLDYVKRWLDLEKLDPIEIPHALRIFNHRFREVYNGIALKAKGLTDASMYFIKDISELKAWNSLLYDEDVSELIRNDRLYSVSEKVSFLSEYRVFVFNDEAVYVGNYLGDPLVFPDENTIRKMIFTYKLEDHPKAYTLDIGIIEKDGKKYTVPIEVHPFTSCGLYGFNDEKLIPDMLEAGCDWYISKSCENENDCN